MAFVHADWTILRTSGGNPLEIDYVGDAHAGTTPSYATGIELHRALQDFADDSADGTEEISVVDEVPSARGGVDTNISLINGYHITPTSITPGDQLKLLTAWSVQKAYKYKLTIFVHLLDDIGNIIAQQDALAAPSWQWDNGDRILHQHVL